MRSADEGKLSRTVTRREDNVIPFPDTRGLNKRKAAAAIRVALLDEARFLLVEAYLEEVSAGRVGPSGDGPRRA